MTLPNLPKKLKHIEVNCPVFKGDIHYVINCNYKEFEKYCKKNFKLDTSEDYKYLEDADGVAIILMSDDRKEMYRVIWLEKFSMKYKHLGVLVHETTHAVIRFLEWKGIPFSSNDNQDETMAYLMDYFISNFIYEFTKSTKKVKQKRS